MNIVDGFLQASGCDDDALERFGHRWYEMHPLQFQPQQYPLPLLLIQTRLGAILGLQEAPFFLLARQE